MSKQRGALLVFKKGTPKDKIDSAMKMLVAADIIDTDYYYNAHGEVPIYEFVPEWGGPVWYIP